MLQHACLKLWEQPQELRSPAAPVVLLHTLQGTLYCTQLPCGLLLDMEGSALAPFACLLITLRKHRDAQSMFPASLLKPLHYR